MHMLREIFGNAYKAFRKSFRYIALISLFVHIPRNAIIVSIPGTWLSELNAMMQMSAEELLVAAQSVQSVMYIGLVMYTVLIIFDPLIVAGLTYIAIKTLANEDVELAGILDNTLQKWPSLMFTAFLFYALATFGMFLIIPGIYIMVVFVFYTMVVVDIGKWGFAALAESFRLVKGNFFKTVFVLLLTSVLGVIVNNIFTYARYFEADFANRVANVLMLTLRDTYTGYFTMVLIMYYFYLTKTKKGGELHAAE